MMKPKSLAKFYMASSAGLGNNMRTSVVSRINTDTAHIQTLIAGIQKGEIKIPAFQRAFVWREDQAFKLLDSLANNYPVGSLLLWRTKEKLRAERNIGEYSLPATDDMDPTDYVLDGQQRLTVIYSCLGAKEADDGFSVAYDLEAQKFIRISAVAQIHQFPMRKLFNTTQLLNFRAALQTHKNASTLQSRLDGLIGAFTEYRLPVVTLKDLTVEEVCPIFERINSSGTKLSTYDLMVAATWNREFDLNDEVDEIRDVLAPKGFGDIDRETVLKCLAAAHLGTIKERSLMTLREVNKDEMKELAAKTKKSLSSTVDLLSTEFKIYSWDFLSYEAIAVILSVIYTKTNHLAPDQVNRARQWFWRASFAERYKVGGENFVSNDIKVVSDFVMNGVGAASDFGVPPTKKQWMGIGFRKNVSRSRAFVLALATRRPRNITNGATIDPAEALSAYNEKQFHHIFPRAYLRRQGGKNDNIVLNICMLAAAANKIISDGDPNNYLPACAKSLGRKADAVFASNLLPQPTEFDYESCSYEEFISARVKLVTDFVDELCRGAVH